MNEDERFWPESEPERWMVAASMPRETATYTHIYSLYTYAELRMEPAA